MDAHTHLGECCVFGLSSTAETLVRRMDESGTPRLSSLIPELKRPPELTTASPPYAKNIQAVSLGLRASILTATATGTGGKWSTA